MVERHRAGEPNKLTKTRNAERIVCRWQNDRKRGQPARYMCRQGTSSVATQDVAPTCAHLTALARTFSSRQLAMGGNLRRCSTEGSGLTCTFDANNSRRLTSAVIRERGRCWNKGIYVNGGERSGSRVPLFVRERAVPWSRFATSAVTMTTRHSIAFRSFISGDVQASWEKSTQPRAAHHSREHSYSVAFRDGCCDNDDRLVARYRSHALRNICSYGSVFGSRGAARCSRGRSYLVALRDGYCDNDDAKSESITFSYIGILCGIYYMGAFWQPWCRSLFESAQLLGRDSRRAL